MSNRGTVAEKMTGVLGMRSALVSFLALLLVACTPDVRGVPLSDVDFSDKATVSALASRLDPDERTALLTYAAIHVPGTVGFCGRNLIGESGEEPVTIGDAVRLTLARDREVRESFRLEQEARTGIDLAAEELGRLVDQKELLIHRQSMLLAEHGGAARELPEWNEIQGKIHGYDAELKIVRRKLEFAGSSAMPLKRTAARYPD